jgi:CO/xanthine dehydrogenase FAD-binding subunit
VSACAWIDCRTLDEATAALARHGSDARVVAGGTDLMIELRGDRPAVPSALVNLAGLAELGGIAVGAGIRIGAIATHAELAASPTLRARAPLLSEACASVGAPQIRNRGTLGGNVMNAAPCADGVPALVALGALATLRSTRGERRVPIAGLFVKPYVTRARPDEVLTSLEFDPLPPGSGSTFLKLGRRNALAIARLSVAAVLACNGSGTIADARLVPGAGFPVWRRVAEAERLLIGERPSAALFTEAGAACARAMRAESGRRWSTEYKEPVLEVLVRRALERCVRNAVAECAEATR